MHTRLICFVSGLALYNFVVYVGGFLSAIQIPKQYFTWFGEHKVLALFLVEAAVVALPVFLLCLLWSYVTIRGMGRSSRQATLCTLGGLVLAWLGWFAYSAVSLASNPEPNQLPLQSLLFALLVPPVWGILNLVAPPAGVVVAGMLAQWSNPSIERTA